MSLCGGISPAEAARRALTGEPQGEAATPSVRATGEPVYLKKVSRRALALLLRELADGPRRASEIERLARNAGVGRRALGTARGYVCERPRKHGRPGGEQYWTYGLRSSLPGWLARRGVRP